MDANEKCPWCGSVISREKFLQIESQIREQERKRHEEVEASMRKELEAQFSQNLEAAKRATVQKLQEEANKRIAQAAAERDKTLEQLTRLQAREAEARKQAQEANESVATLKKNLDHRLEAERQAAEKRVKQETEAMFKKEMERQRIILQQAHDADLSKQKSESHKQTEALLKKVQDMERKLEQKTADQLGDGAEVDLYDALRQEFAGDKITRVLKGQAGPDIRHWVMYKGESCGQIVYDSKNQQQWREAWVTKLRQDQIDVAAQHAILATTVFPSPKKELCIESGVIVVNPARAVYVSHLLRNAMIAMHVRGLGEKERAGKTNQLYEYIASNEHKQKFDQAVTLNKAIQQLDVEEKEAHSKVWNKRGTLLKKQQHALEEIETEVAAIVEAPAAGHSSAA